MIKNKLFTDVHDIEKELIGIKTNQPIGSDSVRSYETLSNNQWDFTWTPSSEDYNGVFYGRNFRVVFKSNNQSAPFANLRVIAEVNGSKYDPLSYRIGGSSMEMRIADDVFNSGDITNYAADNVFSWFIFLQASSTSDTLTMKFIVTATDTGKVETVSMNG